MPQTLSRQVLGELNHRYFSTSLQMQELRPSVRFHPSVQTTLISFFTLSSGIEESSGIVGQTDIELSRLNIQPITKAPAPTKILSRALFISRQCECRRSGLCRLIRSKGVSVAFGKWNSKGRISPSIFCNYLTTAAGLKDCDLFY